MKKYLSKIGLCLCLAQPLARAENVVKDPFSYPLRTYAAMMGIALFGGLVSFYAKVRKGEVRGWSVTQLAGELTTSGFAGMLAFWACEYSGAPPLLTPVLVGIAGHMGTRAIGAIENWAAKKYPLPQGEDSEPHA